MSPEELDRIAARAATSTPGPWSLEAHSSGDDWYVIAPPWSNGFSGSHVVAVVSDKDHFHSPEQSRANALFICQARADFPTLLAEIRRLHRLGGL